MPNKKDNFVSAKPQQLAVFLLCSLGFWSAWSQVTTPSQNASETTATQSIVAEPVLKNKLRLKTSVLGSGREDRYMRSHYVGGTISLDGEAIIYDKLSSRLGVMFLLGEGSYSNLYSAEGKAPKATILTEAILEYTPWEFLALQAGLVDTVLSPFSSSLDSNSFPGLKETMTWKGSNLSASLMSIQAIPTSATAYVASSEAGRTSSFLAVGTELSTNPNKDRDLTLQASYSYFEFNDLTSSAAADSMGNNSIQPSKNPRFMYGFAGTETGLGLSYKFTDTVTMRLSGTFLKNELAPDGKNTGYIYSGSLAFPALAGTLTASGGYYYNESDTVPGAYTVPSRGGNNSFGRFASLRHQLKKEKVSSFIRFTQINQIEARPLQDDRNTISLGLEVNYDVL